MKDMLQISQRSLDKPSHFGKMCLLQFPLQISEDLYFSRLYRGECVSPSGHPMFFLLSARFRIPCAGNMNLAHYKHNNHCKKHCKIITVIKLNS